MNPQTAGVSEISQYARALFTGNRDRFASFEEAAQFVVEDLYKNVQQEDGSPAFALVRIYRLTILRELPASLTPLVDPMRERWMTLMGTYGEESAWQDRNLSQGHKALNLGADQSPMVSAALVQLGLDGGIDMPEFEIDLPMPEATFMTRYFHVEHAPGSPYIPAQEPFVKPYGIQSVIGLGNTFASESMFVLLAFSKVHLTTSQAAALSQMAPFIGTLLAGYDAGKIWTAA